MTSMLIYIATALLTCIKTLYVGLQGIYKKQYGKLNVFVLLLNSGLGKTVSKSGWILFLSAVVKNCHQTISSAKKTIECMSPGFQNFSFTKTLPQLLGYWSSLYYLLVNHFWDVEFAIQNSNIEKIRIWKRLHFSGRQKIGNSPFFKTLPFRCVKLFWLVMGR